MAKVVRFHELGGPEVLRLEEHPVGEPGPGEVRIRVDAIGLNRSEANFRRGRYLDKVRRLPSGLGYEAAGEVEAAGPGVTGFEPGEPVSVLPTFPQSRYHVYGEQAIVPASAVVRRPAGVGAVEGAAVWMPYLTAYGALLDIGGLRPADHVVITAASSSVGLAAIQVANRIGAIPIATTNSTAKKQPILDAGAAAVIVMGEDNLVDQVLGMTGGRGVEFVFDAVAGSAIQESAKATAVNGTLFVHGSLSGEATPLPGLDTMRGVFTRPYTLFEITNDEQRLRRAKHFVASGLQSGAFRPAIDRVFDLDEIVAAHRYLESGAQVGKIVVTVRPGGMVPGADQRIGSSAARPERAAAPGEG
jgi:NADPH:quinone reductase-like Zn-dependent oxidoreductase